MRASPKSTLESGAWNSSPGVKSPRKSSSATVAWSGCLFWHAHLLSLHLWVVNRQRQEILSKTVAVAVAFSFLSLVQQWLLKLQFKQLCHKPPPLLQMDTCILHSLYFKSGTGGQKNSKLWKKRIYGLCNKCRGGMLRLRSGFLIYVILGSASHCTVGSMKVGALAHEIMRAVLGGNFFIAPGRSKGL